MSVTLSSRQPTATPFGLSPLVTDESLDVARRTFLSSREDWKVGAMLGWNIQEMAAAAWACEEFYDAITPDTSAIDEALARKRQKRRDYINNRSRSPQERIRSNIASRIWYALRGYRGGLFSRVGYTVEQLQAHLEARFQEGMTWDNYGAWHIDHIKPVVLFDQTNPVEFMKCWALSNLQPLWSRDNIRKGAKYAHP
jgi:hypothetical protein